MRFALSRYRCIAPHALRCLCLAQALIGWLVLLLLSPAAEAQRTVPTASRRADLQIGAGCDLTQPDYTEEQWKGITGYATLDVATHFGVEFIFHQANSSDGLQLYERTYELGPRYVLHYGRFSPFVRATYGRGVFNFPNSIANLAYNNFGLAGGADVRLKRHVNVRAEYETVRWTNFPTNGLAPVNLTVGSAYHF